MFYNQNSNLEVKKQLTLPSYNNKAINAVIDKQKSHASSSLFNKMQHKYFIFLILGVFLSCKAKIVETKYESGKIHERYQVDDKAMKNGKYEAFYESGPLREVATYKHNMIINKKSFFRLDGTLEIEENYDSKGQLQGPYLVYYPNGTSLHIERKYVDNAIQGMLKVYYPNGKIKEEITVTDNEENGPFTEYYQNGAVQWKGTYRNGTNEYGDLFQYDSLGNMIKKMLCDTMAVCRTVWKPDPKNPTPPNQ